MKKLLAVLLLLATPALAQAPTVAPGLQYFEGPTIGERWEGADIFQFGAGFNAQTGTTYTVLATDMGKFLTFSNAGAIAVALPQAGREWLHLPVNSDYDPFATERITV